MQNFHECRLIRVVIVPIGDISPEKFYEYSSLIKTFSTIELQNITRDPGHSKSPLDKLNWAEGQVSLNIINSQDYQASDWEDFQVYRKVLGVIGVIHCQRSPDLVGTYARFEQLVQQQYPKAVANICFAFDPMADQPDVARGNLVMIPPGDKKQLSFYLSTLLLDFAYSLIQHLEKMLVEQDMSAYIHTPLDPCKTWEEITKLKKRKQGRLNKWKGDYALLAGSPLDAMMYYQVALDQTRSNSDWEWVAGALEGYVAAIVAKRTILTGEATSPSMAPPSSSRGFHNFTGPASITKGQLPLALGGGEGLDAHSREEQEISEKALEAIGHYNRRKASTLELELTLKLARHHASQDKRQEAMDLLMSAYEIGSDFSTQEKTQLTINIALTCRAMGYHRKFAFFIREAAVLYHKIYNMNVAHHLLSLAATHYQLGDLPSDFEATVLPASNQNLTVSTSTSTVSLVTPSKRNARNTARPSKHAKAKPVNREREGWTFVQRVILSNLVSTAKAINDPATTCRHITYLLRTQQNTLAPFKQQELAQDLHLFAKQMNPVPVPGVLGIPILLKVEPLALPAHLAPVAVPREAAGGGPFNPFIYTPFQKAAKGNLQIMWVQDEPGSVRAMLSNPFAFEIIVQHISLLTTGARFAPFVVTCRIPPHTLSYEVILSGKALESGFVVVKGVLIKAFNMVCEHPVHPTGIAVSLKEMDKINSAAMTAAANPPLISNGSNPNLDDISQVQALVQAQETGVTRIEVVKTLPVLNLRYPPQGVASTLYVGERTTSMVELENCGMLPIDVIDITSVNIKREKRTGPLARGPVEVEDNNEEVEDEEVDAFEWDRTWVSSQLPLFPGQRVSLPMHVFARPESAGANFVFAYSSTQQEGQVDPSVTLYMRKITMPFPLNIQQGPKLVSFDIILSSSRALPALQPFLMSSVPLEINNIAAAAARLASGSGSASVPAVTPAPPPNFTPALAPLMEVNSSSTLTTTSSPAPSSSIIPPHPHESSSAFGTDLLAFNALDTAAAMGNSPSALRHAASDPVIGPGLSLPPTSHRAPGYGSGLEGKPPSSALPPSGPSSVHHRDTETENDLCLLVFDIHNPSPQLFTLSCFIEPEPDYDDDPSIRTSSSANATPTSSNSVGNPSSSGSVIMSRARSNSVGNGSSLRPPTNIRSPTPPSSFIKRELLIPRMVSMPQSTLRAFVPMRRGWFPPEGQVPAPKMSSRRQYIKPKKKRTDREEYEWRLMQLYRSIILRRIRITWESIDHTFGTVMLQRLDMSMDLLKKLRKEAITLGFALPPGAHDAVNHAPPSPLPGVPHIHVSTFPLPHDLSSMLEGVSVSPPSTPLHSTTATPFPTPASSISRSHPLSHSAGAPVMTSPVTAAIPTGRVHFRCKQFVFEQISFTIRNKSGSSFRDLVLNIQPFQDYGNGSRTLDLSRKMAWVGTLQVHVPVLLPYGKVEHPLTVCFLEPGVFMFITTCTRHRQNTASPDSSELMDLFESASSPILQVDVSAG